MEIVVKSKVSIIKGLKKPTATEIKDAVRKAVELVGGLDSVKSGDVVLIKPNVCAPAEPGRGVYTNPDVSKAIADLVREKGGRAVIGESAGVSDPTEDALAADGYTRLREEGYEVIDLKGENTEAVTVPLPHGVAVKELTLPKIALDASLVISVPVMKTHPGQMVTIAMKNLKGMLPDNIKKKYHLVYGVAQGMVDMLMLVKPGLAIVDGLIGQEGLGPMQGDPVEMGIIIAGKDLVAVDTVASTIMGYEPEEIPMIVAAVNAGLGTSDMNNIEVVGTPISDVKRRFKRPNEAVEEQLQFPEGFELIIGDKACTGCREGLLMAMYGMKAENQLDMLAGWTVVVGQTDSIPEVDQRRLMMVGKCLSKYKKLGSFVEGCPPWGWQVVNVLKGEPQDHPR